VLTTDLQKHVFFSLLEKVGSGPAAFYLDSCTLQHLSDHFLAGRLLVAHALREMRGGIEERIKTTLPDDGSGMLVLVKLKSELHKLAHRRGLELPEAIDEAFRARTAAIDALLATLLDTVPLPRIQGDATELLQRILSADPPTVSLPIGDEDVRTLRQFLSHVAPGPSAYYHDALRLLDPRFAILATRNHLAAHALRETESGLRAILLPYDFTADEEATESVHRQQVYAILDAYGIARSDDAARAWESITDFSTDRNLALRAHRSGLGLPSPFDDDTLELYRSTIDIFAFVLGRFEHQFAKYLHKMDELLASKNVQKKAFLGTLPQTAPIYDYFFRRLDDPAWIAALADTDALRRVPEPWREGEGIVYPAWPQGDYLRRMLQKDASVAPSVAELVEGAMTSANPRVHEASVLIAALLPEPLCVVAAERETVWLKKQTFVPFLLAEAVGTLAGALAAHRRPEPVAALLRTVIRFDVVSDDGGNEIRLRTDRLALEQLLTEVVPKLAATCGIAILGIVSDALQAFRVAQHPGLTPPTDYSYLWRSTIEKSDENDRGDLRDAMIDALRDGAAALASIDHDSRRQVLEWLSERPWNIERRIALHVTSIGMDSEFAGTLAAQCDLLTSDDCWHEMTRLLRAHGPRFSDAARTAVATCIESLATSTEDELQRRQQWRQLGRLLEPLPPELASLAAQRREEFGPTPASDGPALPRASWVATITPLSRQQLALMELPEIVEYLRAWTPRPLDFHTMSRDSPGALAEELRAVVAMRPNEYADATEFLRGLAPVYIRGVVGGLGDAVKNGARFDLTPALALLTWIVRQPRRINDHRVVSADDHEESWVQVLLAVLDLLEAALRRRSLPEAALTTVTSLLLQLTRDPNPSAEDDADYSGIPERWLANAIGSVRGQAIRTFVLLASTFPSDAALRQGLLAAIEERLDPRIDASPSVRFAIGMLFVTLLRLDAEWARSHVDVIFGETAELREASWEGYLHNGITVESARLLRGRYEDAIDALDSKGIASEADQRVAQHVMLLTAYGDVTFAQEDLLVRFFTIASAALRYHALWFVATHARAAAPSKEVLQKFTELWAWRLENGADNAELRAFDDWFLSDRFQREWALDQLTTLANRGVRFFRYTLVIESLEALLSFDARHVISTARAITEVETDAVQINAARRDLHTLVARARGHDDPTVRNEARRLANIASARGLTDFKALA
jgi:hypothetical protein